MKLRISFWGTFFFLFLALMCFHGIGAREMTGEELSSEAQKIRVGDLPEGIDVLKLHSNDGGEQHGHGHGHSSSSHMDHLDPSVIVFFTMEDLKLGKTLPIYFARKHIPPSLPKEKADSIPFSYAQLPYLLKFFSFPQGSPQAKAMANTLRECEIKPIKGETKLCATSHESMLEFVHTIFASGEGSNYFRLTTSYLTNSRALLQNYTILEAPKEMPAPKMVACHTMPYPYAVFYCHSQLTENRVFKVSLRGQNGDRVDALAVCHLDTSAWSPDHMSFRVLGIQPGSSPVCHFFPADNLVWLPRPLNLVE